MLTKEQRDFPKVHRQLMLAFRPLNRFVSRAVARRWRASSLVDLTVSMVLLTLVTGAALVLYLQVTHSGDTLQQLQWELWLSDYARQTQRTQGYQNQQLTFAAGRVERKVSFYRQNPRLILLELTFYPAETRAKASHHREILANPQ